jgi:uncharacterized membrane protein YjdF
MKSRALILSLISVFSVGVIHFLGSRYELYYLISWYDSLNHFIAGIGIGALSMWILHSSLPHASYRGVHSLVWILSTTIFIGVAWEVFELHAGLIDLFPSRLFSYGVDTTKDLILDIFGAMVAYSLITKKK